MEHTNTNVAVASTNFDTSTTLPKSMWAIVYDQFGDANVLQWREVPVPRPDDRQVVIAVHAAGVNPIDYRLRSGEGRLLIPGGFPRVPGYDVSGVVVETHPDSEFAIGDRVMAFLDEIRGGAYAQFACCSDTSVAKIPLGMSFEEAAAIPLAGTTALQALRDHAHIEAGQRVLINGASGGVGVFAVQIAKAFGAHVTGVASRDKETFVRSLGADEFLDYHETDFTESSKAWDIIFDAAGKSSYWKARSVLTEHGHYISTEPSIGGAMTTILTKLFSKHGEIILARPDADDLYELIRLFEANQLRVEFDDIMSVMDAVLAHERIQHGVDRGKIVLQVTRPLNS